MGKEVALPLGRQRLMPRYVALLRAINVGKRIVKMDRLRSIFQDAGLKNVETFIASGNVLFDATAKSSDAIEKRIESALETELGYVVETFVRTPAELAAITVATPFAGSKQHAATNNLYIGFLKATPPAEMTTRLVALKTPNDEFRVVGREYYWSCRTSLGQSPETAKALGKILKLDNTVRSITTVRKLAELGGRREA
jgi:uncharacterized protein (DUF1697 family)